MNQDVLSQEITPSVSTTLGGKEYKLAFSMASVIAFKQKTGRNLFTTEGWKGLNPQADPEAVGAFIWSAMITYQDSLSYDAAVRMVNFGNMKTLFDKCQEAAAIYLPKSEKKADDPNEQTAVATQ